MRAVAAGLLLLAVVLSGCLWVSPVTEGDQGTISTSLTIADTSLSPSFMQFWDVPMSALDQLGVASSSHGFTMTAADYGWGMYVVEIAGVAAGGSWGWVYEVNGQRVAMGAQAYMLEDGDAVVWQLVST